MEITLARPERRVRRHWRNYSDDVKAAAIRLVLEEGKTVAEGSRQLGLSKPLLRNWVAQALASRARLTLPERDIVQQAFGSLTRFRHS